jgi:hypothetical protein
MKYLVNDASRARGRVARQQGYAEPTHWTPLPEAPDAGRIPVLQATSQVPVVSMVVFNDRLFVATAEGVFERGQDGVFRECRFEPHDGPT